MFLIWGQKKEQKSVCLALVAISPKSLPKMIRYHQLTVHQRCLKFTWREVKDLWTSWELHPKFNFNARIHSPDPMIPTLDFRFGEKGKKRKRKRKKNAIFIINDSGNNRTCYPNTCSICGITRNPIWRNHTSLQFSKLTKT